MPAESPLFLSYSRKDYHFAESLAFHLLRQGVPVWLDVRDLEPGKDWERGLEEALDAATAVVLVASPASIESPHVRNEWQRALRQGKRIVVARIGRTNLPVELQQCESVDFRRAFGGALRQLVAGLKEVMPAAGPSRAAGRGRSWIGMPPWIALMAMTLAVPSVRVRPAGLVGSGSVVERARARSAGACSRPGPAALLVSVHHVPAPPDGNDAPCRLPRRLDRRVRDAAGVVRHAWRDQRIRLPGAPSSGWRASIGAWASCSSPFRWRASRCWCCSVQGICCAGRPPAPPGPSIASVTSPTPCSPAPTWERNSLGSGASSFCTIPSTRPWSTTCGSNSARKARSKSRPARTTRRRCSC